MDDTGRQAQVHLDRIVGHFGTVPLAAVRPSHVKAWTAQLRAEGLADSYVYALHSRLSQVMSDAMHDGSQGRARAAQGSGPACRWPSGTVLLGAFAGLRLAEACGLRLSDVDFMRGVIHPAVQYPTEPLKAETARTAVPVPQSLAVELSAHVAARRSETVLTDLSGHQLAPWTLERAVRAARVKVEGLPEGFRYHDLRHYMASLLIASGADVKVVQARLRHASAKTTLDTYGHLWPDSDDSTRAAIDSVMTARADYLRTAVTR